MPPAIGDEAADLRGLVLMKRTARSRCRETVDDGLSDLAEAWMWGGLTRRERLTLGWITTRCEACRACPDMLRRVDLMRPCLSDPPQPAAVVIPLKRAS